VPVARKAGLARNPRTGETVKRAASKTARFRVGEGLKSALN
jgi:DNA-binding protein HU-beta